MHWPRSDWVAVGDGFASLNHAISARAPSCRVGNEAETKEWRCGLY